MMAAGAWAGPFPPVYVDALDAVQSLLSEGRLDEAYLLAADALTATEVDEEGPGLTAVLHVLVAEVRAHARRWGQDTGQLEVGVALLTVCPMLVRGCKGPSLAFVVCCRTRPAGATAARQARSCRAPR